MGAADFTTDFQPTRTDKIFISVGIFFINFVIALDNGATGTIQPIVLSEFNAMTRAGVISTVNYLLVAGIRPVFAKICEVFGHFNSLVLSLLLHTVGFMMCFSAFSFGTIFAGTVISVLGSAGYTTVAAIMIADLLPIHLRGSVTAYVSVPMLTNYYLGIEVGYALITRWRSVYVLLLLLAILCSIPSLLSLFLINRRNKRSGVLENVGKSGQMPGTPANGSRSGSGNDLAALPQAASDRSVVDVPRVTNETMNRNGSTAAVPETLSTSWLAACRRTLHALIDVVYELDLIGLLLICGSIIAILIPLSMHLNTIHGWASFNVILPLVVGVIGLAFFVYYERFLARSPVVPIHLFKIRTFTCAIVAAIFFYFTSNVSLFYFSPYIQVTREVSARTAMWLQLGSSGYYVGLFLGGWAMQFSKRYRRWAWLGWLLWFVAVCMMIRTRDGNTTTNAEIAVVQAILGVGSGIVIGCVGIGVQAAVRKPDVPIAVTLYGMVAYLGGVFGEGTSTTIWVNVLPAKLRGRLEESIDIYSAINDITYYFALPEDQRRIIQEGYISTQRILTICGICSMLVAAGAMLGLAPYDLSVKVVESDSTLTAETERERQDSDKFEGFHSERKQEMKIPGDG